MQEFLWMKRQGIHSLKKKVENYVRKVSQTVFHEDHILSCGFIQSVQANMETELWN
jgi:hypothetical protein